MAVFGGGKQTENFALDVIIILGAASLRTVAPEVRLGAMRRRYASGSLSLIPSRPAGVSVLPAAALRIASPINFASQNLIKN